MQGMDTVRWDGHERKGTSGIRHVRNKWSGKEDRHLVKLWWAEEIFLGVSVVCGQRFGAGRDLRIEKDAFVAGENDVQGRHGWVSCHEGVPQGAEDSFGCVNDAICFEDLGLVH